MPRKTGLMSRPNGRNAQQQPAQPGSQTPDKIAVSDVELANKTLQDICLDTKAPAAARAQAARTLLEMAGVLKNPAQLDKNKQNQELTLEEIDRKIASFGPETPETAQSGDDEI